MLGSTISGLMAANKGIDVTSNNISNGSTVGFKQSTVSYADIFPNDPSASPKTAIGAGVAVSSVNKNMSQGSISSSGKVTDLAITGNGFFVLGTALNSNVSDINSNYPSVITGTLSSGYNNYLDPTYIDPNLTITGSGTIDSVSVMIQNPDPNDKLIFNGYNGITFNSYDPSSGVLRISGNGSLSDYQNALRLVQFQTSSTAKSGIRNISFSLNFIRF